MNVNHEHLVAAFDALRGPDWPVTVDQALAGVHRNAINLAAWRLAHGHSLTATAAPAVGAFHAFARQAGRPLSPPLPFDHKRAAAGDRDE